MEINVQRFRKVGLIPLRRVARTNGFCAKEPVAPRLPGGVNPKFMGEVTGRECRSFDSAKARSAQDDRLFWGLKMTASFGASG
jgi:hypothetical protein